MPSAGFEPAILAVEQPQTYALTSLDHRESNRPLLQKLLLKLRIDY
jgi:hypothetical protein